jgi:hypothetical protein
MDVSSKEMLRRGVREEPSEKSRAPQLKEYLRAAARRKQASAVKLPARQLTEPESGGLNGNMDNVRHRPGPGDSNR